MRFIVTIVLIGISVCGMYARDFETDFRDVQNLFEERVPTTDSELQEYLHNYPYTSLLVKDILCY